MSDHGYYVLRVGLLLHHSLYLRYRRSSCLCWAAQLAPYVPVWFCCAGCALLTLMAHLATRYAFLGTLISHSLLCIRPSSIQLIVMMPCPLSSSGICSAIQGIEAHFILRACDGECCNATMGATLNINTLLLLSLSSMLRSLLDHAIVRFSTLLSPILLLELQHAQCRKLRVPPSCPNGSPAAFSWIDLLRQRTVGVQDRRVIRGLLTEYTGNNRPDSDSQVTPIGASVLRKDAVCSATFPSWRAIALGEDTRYIMHSSNLHLLCVCQRSRFFYHLRSKPGAYDTMAGYCKGCMRNLV